MATKRTSVQPLLATAIFFLVVRPLNRLAEQKAAQVSAPAPVRECLHCRTTIPEKATRCPA